MVYGTYNELVIGAFVNQLITFGAPHCDVMFSKKNALMVEEISLKQSCSLWSWTKSLGFIGSQIDHWWQHHSNPKHLTVSLTESHSNLTFHRFAPIFYRDNPISSYFPSENRSTCWVLPSITDVGCIAKIQQPEISMVSGSWYSFPNENIMHGLFSHQTRICNSVISIKMHQHSCSHTSNFWILRKDWEIAHHRNNRSQGQLLLKSQITAKSSAKSELLGLHPESGRWITIATWCFYGSSRKKKWATSITSIQVSHPMSHEIPIVA